jgi:hypothetical protein
MTRNPMPADRRQRRLLPITEPSLNLPAEQQRELRMAMADLLLRFSGSNSPSRDDNRSTEDESQANR